jgi:hypothetical protein
VNTHLFSHSEQFYIKVNHLLKVIIFVQVPLLLEQSVQSDEVFLMRLVAPLSIMVRLDAPSYALCSVFNKVATSYVGVVNAPSISIGMLNAYLSNIVA